MGTMFSEVYDRFLSKVTDDMYIELTPEDTLRDLQNLLINAVPGFEFPRKSMEYSISTKEVSKDETTEGMIIPTIEGSFFEDTSTFNETLTSEEVNILAILMMQGWVQRQVTSIENTRMKYSGPDFKMTSQANHLSKLLALLHDVERESLHMQRLYKRRRVDENGKIVPNWDIFGGRQQW